ncbi:hypothetical protein DFH28DRAFT_1057322 [Melampsora americana]|nr:hypothetical protein DFH28DRAFT_1057322 [Melampsora americana]
MSTEVHQPDLDFNHQNQSSSSTHSIKSQFSLQNGKVFQTIFEKASEYGLSKSDQEVLLDGRQSMITYTRLGFMIGAMIAPLPLFIKSKSSFHTLPVLISTKTNQPNWKAIKSRVWWIGKSVTLTTLGSALGSWFGFYFGLKGLNKRIDQMDGMRDRFEKALEAASDKTQIGNQDRVGFENERDEVGFDLNLIQESDQKKEEERIENRLNSTSNPSLSTHSSLSGSRWEELRKERLSKPSTWDQIREEHFKSNLITDLNRSNPSTERVSRRKRDEDESNSKELQRIEFEELLEKERRLCREDEKNEGLK